MAKRLIKTKLPSNKEFEEWYKPGPDEDIRNIVEPIDKGKETGKKLVLNFMFDCSGSMEDPFLNPLYEDNLAACFNEVVIKSLNGAAAEYKYAIRVGAALFSNEIVPIWNNFKSLQEVGKNPFHTSFFNLPGLKGLTSLHRAMITGLRYTGRAMGQLGESKTSSTVEGCLAVFTDGANNQSPTNASAVKEICDMIKDKSRMRTILAYFETGDGLTNDQFAKMARDTGFSEIYYFDESELKTPLAKERKFRHFLDIFSKRSLQFKSNFR